MDILSIGNSFSQDAQRYLHSIARVDGVELNCFNLYIGGCSLSQHFRNLMGDKENYMLQVNGHHTGFFVSIKEALLNRDWDVVTLQQASHGSTDYGKFQPYIGKLAEYVREYAPKAKLIIHETWAYEEDSPKLNNLMNYAHADDMLSDIKIAYRKAFEDVRADGFIPSGELLGLLLKSGIEKVHRDTYHASLGLGRYALGLLWYRVLTGNKITNNSFSDFDEEISSAEIEIVKNAVEEICR